MGLGAFFVLGLCGQVLVEGWGYRVASLRCCQKLPPCLTEPMPTSYKTDLQMVKAEPIRDGSSTSVIRYLRTKKKLLCRCKCTERREKRQYVRETTLQTARSLKNEGEKVLQMLKLRFP